jgi:hypothetical protein
MGANSFAVQSTQPTPSGTPTQSVTLIGTSIPFFGGKAVRFVAKFVALQGIRDVHNIHNPPAPGVPRDFYRGKPAFPSAADPKTGQLPFTGTVDTPPVAPVVTVPPMWFRDP